MCLCQRLGAGLQFDQFCPARSANTVKPGTSCNRAGLSALAHVFWALGCHPVHGETGVGSGGKGGSHTRDSLPTAMGLASLLFLGRVIPGGIPLGLGTPFSGCGCCFIGEKPGQAVTQPASLGERLS